MPAPWIALSRRGSGECAPDRRTLPERREATGVSAGHALSSTCPTSSMPMRMNHCFDAASSRLPSLGTQLAAARLSRFGRKRDPEPVCPGLVRPPHTRVRALLDSPTYARGTPRPPFALPSRYPSVALSRQIPRVCTSRAGSRGRLKSPLSIASLRVCVRDGWERGCEGSLSAWSPTWDGDRDRGTGKSPPEERTEKRPSSG